MNKSLIPERRELAHRTSAGVDVTLVWQPTLDELIVSVSDENDGSYFEIRPQRYLALDVYYHPYAYADLAGVNDVAEHPSMIRPAEGRR